MGKVLKRQAPVFFIAGFVVCFLLVILLRSIWTGQNVGITESLPAVTSTGATAPTKTASTSTSALPTIVGQCATATVLEVTARLQDGVTGQPIAGSGSQILYTNGGVQVSYDTIKGIEDSRSGDVVRLCLLSVPAHCPPGDVRGRVYHATNLRTGERWVASDSEHSCGGA